VKTNRIKHIVLPEVPESEIVSSQAVVAGNLLFSGGISSRNLRTKEIRGATLEDQCTFMFGTLGDILDKAGLTFSNIVKLNVYLQDSSYYEEFNTIYKRYFKKPFPARLVLIQNLFPSTLVEIEAIALIE
jgi:2-iminobutanoate/2-iminopropanoate deaminase